MPARKTSARRGKRTKSRSRSRAKARAKRPRSRGSSRVKTGGRRVGRRLPTVSSIQLPQDGPSTMQYVKFNSYIRKVLKKIRPDQNLNSHSMKIMDSLVKDTLHQIASTAAEKMGKKKTLKPKLIFRATKRMWSKPIACKIDELAQKAVDRYSNNKKRH